MNKIIKKRWIEILKILFNRTTPITVTELAKILQVSNRTIRNDLNGIEEFLEEKDTGHVIRKPGIGIWLDIKKGKEDEFKEVIYNKVSYIQPYSPEERQLYILTKLLETKKPIIMEELAKELFVSRITILKDLNKIEESIKKYKVSLLRKQNYGIEIKGEEKDIRRLIGDIISEDEISPYIKKILDEVEEELEFKLSEEASINLSKNIAISMRRSKLNKKFNITEDTKNQLENKEEYKMATLIGKKIEDIFGLLFLKEEIYYITIHLLGSKFQFRKNHYNNENVHFAREIIDLIGNILSIDLTDDKQLLNGLALHLRPTINRLKFGLKIENPLLEEVKKNYPSIFGASWASSTLFEKQYGVEVPEEEIAYITIHIGAALERQNYKTKVVVVCISGVGTSQLVSIRLEKAISNLEIVRVVSKQELSTIDYSTFDLIISTVDIKEPGKAMIKVSPFINHEDVKKIKEWIGSEGGKKYYRKTNSIDKTSKLFKTNLIFPKLNFKRKEEVITFLVKELVGQGYVKGMYLDEALERELITSTAIGKGIAIPHGSPGSVIEQVVAVATLNEPIDWSGNMVDIVFIIAFRHGSKNIVKMAFRKFYNMLDNEEKIEKLRNVNDKNEAYKLLTN